MRHFAGPIAHRISSIGLMLVSSILALAGLLLLSNASNPFTALVAAAVWGVGVCFMWPTMMAIAADRYPRGGAWAIGLIASAGALAIYFVLPWLGGMYDRALADSAGGTTGTAGLAPAEMLAAQAKAAAQSFKVVAIFPAILIAVFGLILLMEKLTQRRLAASA
jgi:MFS family permease